MHLRKHHIGLRRHASRSLRFCALLELEPQHFDDSVGELAWIVLSASGLVTEDAVVAVSAVVLWPVVAVAVQDRSCCPGGFGLPHPVSSSFLAVPSQHVLPSELVLSHISLLISTNVVTSPWSGPSNQALSDLRVRFHSSGCHPIFVSILGLFPERALRLQEWQILNCPQERGEEHERDDPRNRCLGKYPGFPSCEDLAWFSTCPMCQEASGGTKSTKIPRPSA